MEGHCEHPSLTLSELAARAGLPLSIAHRLVAELAAWAGQRRGGEAP